MGKKRIPATLALWISLIIFISFTVIVVFLVNNIIRQQKEKSVLTATGNVLQKRLTKATGEISALRSVDQFKRNEQLQSDIASIEATYKDSVRAYEKLLDFKQVSKKTDDFDKEFAYILSLLSERNYASAGADLKNFLTKIESEKQKILSSFTIPANLAVNNTPPGSGYSRQIVQSDVGEFMVDIITADLNSTRVVVDTASDGDCRNDCPVLSLGDYVSRSGAYAGINGSYFCPASYPSCSDKKNSFDTLLMNKNKTYFNSDNNVYSTVPAVIFSGSSARFVGRSLEWGRDTGVDAVIANQPLLVSNGAVAFNGDGEPKHGSKGNRSFIAASGSTAYMGIVYNATVAEAAHALQAMGIQNALNLDSGGSTALWNNGYKAGPGRNIPNAVLFIRK